MKKILLVLTLFITLTLSACTEAPKLVTITFETNGGLEVLPVELKGDVEFTLPSSAKEGHEFNGWYLDSELTTEVGATVIPTEDMTLYAKFTENEEEPGNPIVTITVRDFGVMTLELYPDIAPLSVDNFVRYVQENRYTDSTFHRVIEDFMIQGGIIDPTRCPITGEFSSNGVTNDLKHVRGVISMARTSVKNSGTSQFFIMHKDSPHLDGDYAAFGMLLTGFDVLDLIAGVETGGAYDAPLSDVVIESITVDLQGYVPAGVVCAN